MFFRVGVCVVRDAKLHMPGTPVYEAAIDVANTARRRIGLDPIDRSDLGDGGMTTAQLLALVSEATAKADSHDRIRRGDYRVPVRIGADPEPANLSGSAGGAHA